MAPKTQNFEYKQDVHWKLSRVLSSLPSGKKKKEENKIYLVKRLGSPGHILLLLNV